MVHDEFSYLLAADTFARGRLTNPTHPLWIHFESIHIIQRPTYQSKYPPGQGLALAAGQALTGYPIVGAWLAAAAACIAVVWMLRSALPLPWAIFGGLLAALHPVVLRWSRDYWGGAVAMLAGALLLGGLERVIRQGRARGALTMGLGIALLAITRPYEGFVLAILALVRLVVWLLGDGPGRRALAARLALCLIVTAAPGVAWLAYYNFRVTGDALKLPYVEHMDQYQVAPLFVWQAPRPAPPYRHEVLRAFHASEELVSIQGHDTVLGFLRWSRDKLADLGWRYTVLGALAPLLVALAWAVPSDRHLGASAAMLVLFVLGLLPTNGAQAHYAAPAFGLFLLLAAAGARSLWNREWRGWRVGRLIVVMAVALQAAAFVAVVRLEAARRPLWWTAQRARVVAEVRQRAARSLIVVRYGPLADGHAEWVYNQADIDGAPVVWARAMTPERDQALVEYFRDRQVWRLDVNGADVALRAEPSRAP